MSKKPMKSDAQARHDTLCALILAAIEAEGQEHEGRRWAIKPRSEWADALGVDMKTITRLIQREPIQRLDTGAQDAAGTWRRVTALRIAQPGEPPPMRTPEEVAGKMSKMFRKHTGLARLPDGAWGCLRAFAELWPEGHQERIFADLLKNWPGYAAAIKSDPAYDPDHDGKGVDRYRRFPSIGLIRKFQHQVPDFYLTRLQLAGKPLPFPYVKEAA